MLLDTKHSIHFGVSFVVAPQPVLDSRHVLEFQKALADEGIVFSGSASAPDAFALMRQSPPLEVRLQQPGPPVGQIVVLAPNPGRPLELFIEEARAVCEAFSKVWPGDLQVIQRDAVVRQLYSVAAPHSFSFLWEQRLGCHVDELEAFGRPVSGGGLRFVMPPVDGQPDSPNIELKIESFLTDPTKLYIDVELTWLRQAGAGLDPAPMLEEADRFATIEVVAFITGGRA